MRKAKFSVIFNRKNKLNSDGKALVQIRAHLSVKEQVYFSTGIYLAPEMWTGEVHHNHPSAILFNKQIEDTLRDLKDFEFKLNMKGQELTKASLEVYRNTGVREVSFIEFYETRLKKERSIDPNTFRDQRQTLDKLKEYNPSLRFSEINQEFLDEFTHYLLKSLSKNTVTKHYKNLKKYLNLAIDYKEFSYEKYRDLKFRVKYKSLRRVYLDYEDIQKLLDEEFEFKRLEISRLTFLLLCFTGLRSSDILSLKKTDLKFTEHGINIDLHATQKTEDPVFLPMYELFNGIGEVIIKKLLSMSDDNWKFVIPKKLYNQKINNDLKVIQSGAKIGKYLTMHVARHTFCTLLAFESKDPYLVMKYASISKIETAMGYTHLSKELGDSALKQIQWSKKFN